MGVACVRLGDRRRGFDGCRPRPCVARSARRRNLENGTRRNRHNADRNDAKRNDEHVEHTADDDLDADREHPCARSDDDEHTYTCSEQPERFLG